MPFNHRWIGLAHDAALVATDGEHISAGKVCHLMLSLLQLVLDLQGSDFRFLLLRRHGMITD